MRQSQENKGCCLPVSSATRESELHDQKFMAQACSVTRATAEVVAAIKSRLVEIPGGIFEMGARRSTYPKDLDSPRRKVKVTPFLISPCTVSNDDYARFVDSTGYRTVAEQEGWSFVFHLFLREGSSRWPEFPPGLPWWRKVKGACWHAPEGPGTNLKERGNHPVVHIAWYDALAYANWTGLRLPREAEWERVARSGLKHKKFPWGNGFMPDGRFAMNTFQGEFPNRNTGEDGWVGTAPVDAFKPNSYGVYNMTGNVWEWVHDYFGSYPRPGVLPDIDPIGPEHGFARVQRGGSYLCHASYCERYHVHSRTSNHPDSSAGNLGFRLAADIEKRS